MNPLLLRRSLRLRIASNGHIVGVGGLTRTSMRCRGSRMMEGYRYCRPKVSFTLPGSPWRIAQEVVLGGELHHT